MEPETKTVATPLPGQGVQPPAPTSAPEQPAKQTQSDFISREEAQKLIDEAADKAFKRSQALITKSNERIRAEVTRLKEYNQKAGITLTPQQEEVLTDQVRNQVLTESSPAETPGQGETEEDLNPVNKIAKGMMKDAGIEILDTDPEAKALMEERDPYEYTRKLAQAINDKRARTSTATPPAAPHSNPGLGTGGLPPSDVRPGQGHQLLNEYWAEKDGK